MAAEGQTRTAPHSSSIDGSQRREAPPDFIAMVQQAISGGSAAKSVSNRSQAQSLPSPLPAAAAAGDDTVPAQPSASQGKVDAQAQQHPNHVRLSPVNMGHSPHHMGGGVGAYNQSHSGQGVGQRLRLHLHRQHAGPHMMLSAPGVAPLAAVPIRRRLWRQGASPLVLSAHHSQPADASAPAARAEPELDGFGSVVGIEDDDDDVSTMTTPSRTTPGGSASSGLTASVTPSTAPSTTATSILTTSTTPSR